MTPGERAVWAAAFIAELRRDSRQSLHYSAATVGDAVRIAGATVDALRQSAIGADDTMNEATASKLRDILGIEAQGPYR